MITWWRDVGVDRVDLAVRRPRLLPGVAAHVWLWHRTVPLGDLPPLLPWTRAENAREADVYARPARGSRWSVVFLDDLAQAHALELTTRHPGLCVHTSPEGGCQLWLCCDQPLDEQGRYRLQKHLAGLLGADPGSVSGEHLGRLAGYRNWKRRGPWVNVLAATLDGPRLPVLQDSDPAGQPQPLRPALPRLHASAGPDISESGREWGWVMSALEAGLEPDVIYHQLLVRARVRRGSDSTRYARRTVERALQRLSELSPHRRRGH